MAGNDPSNSKMGIRRFNAGRAIDIFPYRTDRGDNEDDCGEQVRGRRCYSAPDIILQLLNLAPQRVAGRNVGDRWDYAGDFAAVAHPRRLLLRLIETDDYTIAMEEAVLCF